MAFHVIAQPKCDDQSLMQIEITQIGMFI